MATTESFRCECGIRLNILTDQAAGGTTTITCPNPSCKLRHYFRGRVLQVSFFDDDGKSVPYYDWNAPQT